MVKLEAINGLWWFMMVYNGLWWFIVVYNQKSINGLDFWCRKMMGSSSIGRNSGRSVRWCFEPWDFGVPSGELTFCHGKSPFLMGKTTISMAIFHSKMLVHQRVPYLQTHRFFVFQKVMFLWKWTFWVVKFAGQRQISSNRASVLALGCRLWAGVASRPASAVASFNQLFCRMAIGQRRQRARNLVPTSFAKSLPADFRVR